MTDLGESTGVPSRERIVARRALLVVAAASVLAQLVLFSFNRPPIWDEAVYLSQVTPHANTILFLPHHARGITLLVAPVTSLGGSIGAVRLFLMGASAVAMVIAFRCWVPLIGVAAPAAAFLFSFTWLGLISASEVMPNLWAAIFGVAVAGLVARRLEGAGTRFGVFAAAALALMALVRPTEATVLFGAISLCVVVFRRGGLGVLVPLFAGLVAGWLPWLIEMSIRFGGPVQALRDAGTAHFAITSVAHNVTRNIAYTDGRISAVAGRHVPPAGVLWWIALVALTVIAFRRARTARHRTVLLIASLASLALAGEYLLFVSAEAARFLLPAYAFVSIPVGVGLVSLVRGRGSARAAGTIVLAMVIPLTLWQVAVANGVESREKNEYALRDVGLEMRTLAAGRPCVFLSEQGYPEVQLAGGCTGATLRGGGPSAEDLADLRHSGKAAFIVVVSPLAPDSPLRSLAPVVVHSRTESAWSIYRIPPSG